MIKRFIFTSLLLLINIAGIAMLLSDPFETEKLVTSGFFIFLLVAYVITWTKGWQKLTHSINFHRTTTILSIIIVSAVFIFSCVELYHALSTGVIYAVSRAGSSTFLNRQDDPWLFWAYFSIYSSFAIPFIWKGIRGGIKEALNEMNR